MKKFLLSLAFVSGFLLASAQNELDIFYQGSLVNDNTLTVYGNINDEVLICQLSIGNNTTSTLNLYVRRVIVQEVSGSYSLFCFGDYCYPPQTDTSGVCYSLAPGAITESFSGDYYPTGTRGATTITYEFFDNVSLDHRVAAQVTVNYHTSGDFTILEGDTTVVNNSTLVVFTSDTQVSMLEKKMRIVNNTNETQQLYVRRIINEEVAGSENLFCFGVYCYPPSTDTSINSYEVYPGVVDSSFKGDYFPYGNAGKTSITYEFFNLAKGREEIRESITVIYNLSGVGIDESTQALQRVYPNPASSYLTIDYNLKAIQGNVSIEIRNMAGQTVIQLPVAPNTSTATLNVSGLGNGVYTYSLIANNRVIATKKLLVQH